MNDILHLHLPKTGGMALHTFLVEQAGSDEVSPPLGGIKLSEALLQWRHVRVISGHFVTTQGEVLPGDRYCITALRNPLDRFISEFYYSKHDLDDLLLDTNRIVLNLDEHVERLAQTSSGESCVQLAMLYPLGTQSSMRLTTDEKLTAAIRALDQFDLVGVTEELEDFAAMLSASMGWLPRQLDHVNVTSQRISIETLSGAQLTVIQRLLEPETELYNHAQARFRRERRACIGRSSGGVGEASAKASPQSMRARDSTSAATEISTPKNFGDKRCEIIGVSVAGNITGLQQVMAGELMNITIEFVAHQAIEQVNAGIAIKDERGMLMYGTNSLLLGDVYALSPGRYAVTFTLLNRLGPGRYSVDASLIRTSSHYDDCYHWWEQASKLTVEAYAAQHYEGRVLMDTEVCFDGISSDAAWRRLQTQPTTASLRSFGRLNDPLQEFRSSIVAMVPIDILPCGVDAMLQMRLTNSSNETWPATGRNPVHLSYRWTLENGEVIVGDGLRTHLSQDVLPGNSLIVSLHVRAPKEAGYFVLAVSLVQEQVAWFLDQHVDSACYLPIVVSDVVTEYSPRKGRRPPLPFRITASLRRWLTVCLKHRRP